MPDIKHSAKRHLNHSFTTAKTIHDGISVEYTDLRRDLSRVAASVKSLTRLTQHSRRVWTGVAKHQLDFAETLVASIPDSGPVLDHAKEVQAFVRTVHPRFVEDDDDDDAPDHRLQALLHTYLDDIDEVTREYPAVELAFTEVQRYQRKVDKLEAKASSHAKANHSDAVARNVTKLQTARADYDEKLAAVLCRMRALYDKHEVVFQIAHHAFWLNQQRFCAALDDATAAIRAESVITKQPLLCMDLDAEQDADPVPRVHVMMAAGATPLIKAAADNNSAESGAKKAVTFASKSDSMPACSKDSFHTAFERVMSECSDKDSTNDGEPTAPETQRLAAGAETEQ